MKKINLIPILFFGALVWIQLSQSSCTNDQLPPPSDNAQCDTLVVTYDDQVATIVNASCAFAGCHGANAPIGDYTDYTKLSTILNANKFDKRVLELQDMPPGGTLTEDELELLTCWAENNYAEN